MRARLLSISITAAVCLWTGAEARAQAPRVTPEDWDAIAGRYPPCAFAAVTADSASATPWTLGRPRGARLWLPASFREVAAAERGTRRWVAPDSSRIEFRVLRAPLGAMAVGGPVQIEREGECALPVAGHRALVIRFRLTDTLTKRVRYVAAVDAFVRPGVAFSASVESPVTGTRDAATRALSTFVVPWP